MILMFLGVCFCSQNQQQRRQSPLLPHPRRPQSPPPQKHQNWPRRRKKKRKTLHKGIMSITEIPKTLGPTGKTDRKSKCVIKFAVLPVRVTDMLLLIFLKFLVSTQRFYVLVEFSKSSVYFKS
jgi:hypothetical protein